MNAWKRDIVKALQEVPIFYRIVIANTAMAGTVIVTLALFGTEAVAMVVVLASGVVNALLVRAALKFDGLQKQQRALFAWSLNEAEAERGRVANEIRESAAQRLAALMLAKTGPEMKSEAAAVMQELVETAERLQPPRIQFLGLPGALSWYARSIEQRTGIHIALTLDGRLDDLAAPDTLALYRMIEDVVETMARHFPPALEVRVAATDDMVASWICSEMPGNVQLAFTATEQFRLTERAACLNGKLDIARRMDSTTVHISIPTRGAHARYDSRLAG